MLLHVFAKDIRQALEELTGGLASYKIFMNIDVGYEIVNNILKIVIPLVTAYIIHKLKKNYWEQNKGFLPISLIIEDLKELIKERRKKK